jgi:hypothetical protein
MAELLIVGLAIGTFVVLKDSNMTSNLLERLQRHTPYPYAQLSIRSMIPPGEDVGFKSRELSGLGTNSLPVYYAKGPADTKYMYRRM